MSIMTLRMLLLAFALLLPLQGTAQPAPGGEDAEMEGLSREQRLDGLYEALAATEGEESNRIANEISRLWAQSGSDSMDLLLTRARKATKEEKFDKARAHVSALTRLAPDFAEGWNASATLYFMQDEYWLAVEHIQRALALEPRHFGALSGLAMILEHVDRNASALEAWREVARIFPGMERARQAVERLEKTVDGNEI